VHANRIRNPTVSAAVPLQRHNTISYAQLTIDLYIPRTMKIVNIIPAFTQPFRLLWTTRSSLMKNYHKSILIQYIQ